MLQSFSRFEINREETKVFPTERMSFPYSHSLEYWGEVNILYQNQSRCGCHNKWVSATPKQRQQDYQEEMHLP